jgi:hypothetical protein
LSGAFRRVDVADLFGFNFAIGGIANHWMWAKANVVEEQYCEQAAATSVLIYFAWVPTKFTIKINGSTLYYEELAFQV